VLGVPPSGVVATACFVMEQSDWRQFFIPVQGGRTVRHCTHGIPEG